MLLALLKGSELSTIILLKDDVECIDVCNEHIIYNFLLNHSKRYDKTVFLCFEKPPDTYHKLLPSETKDRVVTIDATKYSHMWLDFHNHDNKLETGTNVRKLIEEQLPSGNGSFGLIIDSLSFHLLLRPPSFTCQFLHNLSTVSYKGYEIKQIVCGVHQDIFDSQILKQIEHTATSVLTFTPSPHNNSTSCALLHHKTSGKVIRKIEYFHINESLTISSIREENKLTTAIETENDQVDPASNLTFNLSLKESEKDAKNQLILPYTYDKNRKEAALNEPGGGKIFYQADEVDDLDEEDPDDDLNI
ncbi:hypothetical protein LOTGIDRAFT_234064 [Lottia gigantea]|uniref:Elongator complex protein 5 n=1 Tax=Lottia gigantea TaxID=225164 RepID=V3ZFM0_LOTGI|nr:hypothetical protein LOTGIDRAFT_234064 [Lottia gigantea]ESO89953.1 hypothetical protein LOTGIDRAFT_234064 [Lottia gigantea]